MRVCVFTASRSEYGLLKLIFLLQKTNILDVNYLQPAPSIKKYGYSINEIYEDNLKLTKLKKYI